MSEPQLTTADLASASLQVSAAEADVRAFYQPILVLQLSLLFASCW